MTQNEFIEMKKVKEEEKEKERVNYLAEKLGIDNNTIEKELEFYSVIKKVINDGRDLIVHPISCINGSEIEVFSDGPCKTIKIKSKYVKDAKINTVIAGIYKFAPENDKFPIQYRVDTIINMDIDIEKFKSNCIQLQKDKSEFFKQKKLLEDLRIDIKEKANFRKNLKKDIKSKEEEKEQLQSYIEKLNVILEKYEKIGFRDPFQKKEEQKIKWNGTMHELVKYIKNYLEVRKKLFYSSSKRLIERFFSAIYSNQIIILYGPPGTGKTSMPCAIAEALGGKCKVIPVQPNWTDNQDLLGFYNTIENRFVPTAFLDALVEARENPDNIYFVCLDEMNLAHIEYYFSEILSAMETNDRAINLYSEHYYNVKRRKIINEINLYCSEFEKMTIEEQNAWLQEKRNNLKYQEEIAEWEELNRYPAVFSIPRNVQFVGTLNMDETTKGISPKVLDRSFLIEITDNEDEITIEKTDDILNINISIDCIEEFKKVEKESKERIIFDIYNMINNQNRQEDGMEKIHLRISNRLKKQINEMICMGTDDEIKDSIFVGKILPALQCDEISDNSYFEIQRLFQDYKLSLAKLQKMYDVEMNSLDYWR